MLNSLEVNKEKIKYFFTDVDGTLTNAFCSYSAQGELLKNFNLRDGTGFYMLKKLGIKVGIITGEDSLIVQQRANKLKLEYCFLGVKDKYSLICKFLKENNSKFEEFAYIGDDFNDLKLLKASGISFCPSDAHILVQNSVNYVCSNKGGEGAFREASEILLTCNENKVIEQIVSDLFLKD